MGVEHWLQTLKTISIYGGNKMIFRKATVQDLNNIKALVDQHKLELGFVIRSALEKSIETAEIIVAVDNQTRTLVGFVQYRHRKDDQTTLYNIVVHPNFRRQGIGVRLVNELKAEAKSFHKKIILLKCPAQLPANEFYQNYGFSLSNTENGKKRPLKIWMLSI